MNERPTFYIGGMKIDHSCCRMAGRVIRPSHAANLLAQPDDQIP